MKAAHIGILTLVMLPWVSPADDVEIHFVNTRLTDLTEWLASNAAKEVEIKDEDLQWRLLSLQTPRKMTKSEATEFVRAMLAVEGVTWKEVDGKIILSRYLTDEQVKFLKKSMGIPEPTVSYTKTRRPRVVLPSP